jgi:hypothetical protein
MMEERVGAEFGEKRGVVRRANVPFAICGQW